LAWFDPLRFDDIYKFNTQTDAWVHTGLYLNENKGFPQVVPLDYNSLGILGGHTYLYSPKGIIDHPVNHFEVLIESKK
jgi:hypothetical protein